MNLILNLVLLAVFVVVAFWVLGIVAAALALPVVAVTLLKVFIGLVALFAFVDIVRGGTRFTIIK